MNKLSDPKQSNYQLFYKLGCSKICIYENLGRHMYCINKHKIINSALCTGWRFSNYDQNEDEDFIILTRNNLSAPLYYKGPKIGFGTHLEYNTGSHERTEYWKITRDSWVDFASLSMAIIKHINLSNTIINNTNLFKAQFIDSDISNTYMNKNYLEKSTFDNCDLHNSSFFGSDLYMAKFTNCNTKHTSFYECNLDSAHFSEYNMKNSIFRDTILDLRNIVKCKEKLKGVFVDGIFRYTYSDNLDYWKSILI